MTESDKKIPWFSIISGLFSGTGITILNWVLDFVKEVFSIELISTYKKEIFWGLVFLIVLVTVIINFVHYINILKKNTQKASNELSELKVMYDEVQANWENAEQTLATVKYINRGYEELDGYYKKVASIIKVRGPVEDSMIMQYMDKIKSIVQDNCSVRDGKINVTLFQKPQENRESYTIRLSNYHTIGTINGLELSKKSFVGKVFKEKRIKYIPDIENRKVDDPFVVIPNSNYLTILGIPYVVDNVTILTVIITMEEAGALDKVYSECLPLVERYVQVIGLLTMLQNNMEVK